MKNSIEMEIESREKELIDINDKLSNLKNTFVLQSSLLQKVQIDFELKKTSLEKLNSELATLEKTEIEMKMIENLIQVKRKAIEELQKENSELLKNEKQKRIIDFHSKLKTKRNELLPLILDINKKILEIIEIEKQLLNLSSYTEMNNYFLDAFINPILKFLPLFAKDKFSNEEATRFHDTRKLFATSKGLQ